MLVYEAIADAPDSVDLFANGAKFFSQASDVVVYRTIEAIIAVTVLPLVYLINLFVNVILLKSGIQSKGENSMRDPSEVWTGKASSYDRARPTPPPALLDLLTQLIHLPLPLHS